jgi:hypothetical protein
MVLVNLKNVAQIPVRIQKRRKITPRDAGMQCNIKRELSVRG